MSQPENTKSTPADEALITGVLLILLALVANEWLLTKLLSTDGSASTSTLNMIRLFQACILIPAAALIVFRKSFNTQNKKGRLPLWRFGILKSAQLFFILFLVEIAAATLVRRSESAVVETIDEYVKFDLTLGYTPHPNMTSAHKKIVNGETLFETTYTTDNHGRRVLPDIPNLDSRPYHTLLFGGSYTFGHGLRDDQTLAYHLAQQAKNFRPYAYAAPGYGPQQMLVRLESENFVEQIDQHEGVCIYVFIPDHVRRAVGSMRRLNVFARHFPRYILDDNGALKHTGTFANAQPTRLKIYRILDNEYMSKLAGLDIPLRINDAHIDLAAEIIAESRSIYQRLYDNDNFVVLLWPSVATDEFNARRIIPWLEKEGIPYLDYTDLIDTTNPEFVLDSKLDPHPSEKTHIAIAHALARDLDAILSTP